MYVQIQAAEGDCFQLLCRQQNVEDFMDEDELAVLQKSTVKTKAEYDTFGDTAAELAQRAAAADAQARPSAIPGAVFQDLIAPVPDSVGKLCMCAASMVCTVHQPNLQAGDCNPLCCAPCHLQVAYWLSDRFMRSGSPQAY